MIFDDATLLKGEVADLTGAKAITNDGNNSLTVAVLSSSSGATGAVTFEDSDDGVTFAAVAAEQVIGDTKFEATEKSVVKLVGYAGGAKYVKVKCAAEGFVGIVIKGRNRHI